MQSRVGLERLAFIKQTLEICSGRKVLKGSPGENQNKHPNDYHCNYSDRKKEMLRK